MGRSPLVLMAGGYTDRRGKAIVALIFDTNRAINDVRGEAGYPAPETRMAVRNI
jgi:hypothetical protein